MRLWLSCLILTLAGAAVLLTACGPAQSASEKPVPADIRGEPINVPQPVVAHAAASPAVPVVAARPIPLAAPAVTATPISIAAISPPATPVSPVSRGGYTTVGFDKLSSYNFDVPDDGPVTNATAGPDQADAQIPVAVKAFNQKKVSIKGFMLPLKVDDGTVTEFLIMKDQSMCCYGAVPKITDWVSVKTSGKGVKPIMDQPVSILGTLHVGAMRENGYLIGIYQMDGEKLITTGN